jgi:hypothetical protein
MEPLTPVNSFVAMVGKSECSVQRDVSNTEAIL